MFITVGAVNVFHQSSTLLSAIGLSTFYLLYFPLQRLSPLLSLAVVDIDTNGINEIEIELLFCFHYCLTC